MSLRGDKNIESPMISFTCDPLKVLEIFVKLSTGRNKRGDSLLLIIRTFLPSNPSFSSFRFNSKNEIGESNLPRYIVSTRMIFELREMHLD